MEGASGTGSVLETGHASVSHSERIVGFLPGWSPLEWTPGSLSDHGPDSPSGRKSWQKGPVEVVVVPGTGGTGRCH